MKTYHLQEDNGTHPNRLIEACDDTDVTITHCMGERYIGAGMKNKHILLTDGIPGNALGAYLNGATIEVMGNSQDATGDTMNDGEIIIHGRSGDATGYAMRGGSIYIKESTGYRGGIHMKAYEDKFPLLMIGGTAGNFLGEYQAGGYIIVLGLTDVSDNAPIVGPNCGTGMHGGKIYLRTNQIPAHLPAQVSVHPATKEDMEEIHPMLSRFCTLFSVDPKELSCTPFYVLTPNTDNPYRQLYTMN